MRRIHPFLFPLAAYALSSTFPQEATQCAEFPVSFSGEAITPFTLLLLPTASDSPQVISVPDDAWNATMSQGFFTTTIPFAAGTEFLAVLQDGHGRETSVVSLVYSISNSSDNSCVTSQPSFSHTFSSNPLSPTEYGLQTIAWNLPDPSLNFEGGEFLNNLNITSFIPRGQTLVLRAADSLGGSNSAIWQVNIPAGQQFISLFEYKDVNGTTIRETSPIQTVTNPTGGSSHCLSRSSPGLTVEAIDGTVVATATQLPNTQGSSSASTVAISAATAHAASSGALSTRQITIVVGGSALGVVVLACSLLGFLLWRRRHRRLNQDDSNANENTVEKGSSKAPFIDSTAPIGISFPPSIARSSRSNTPSSSRDRLGALPTKRPILRPFRATSRTVTSSIVSWGNRGPLPSSARASLVDP